MSVVAEDTKKNTLLSKKQKTFLLNIYIDKPIN